MWPQGAQSLADVRTRVDLGQWVVNAGDIFDGEAPFRHLGARERGCQGLLLHPTLPLSRLAGQSPLCLESRRCSSVCWGAWQRGLELALRLKPHKSCTPRLRALWRGFEFRGIRAGVDPEVSRWNSRHKGGGAFTPPHRRMNLRVGGRGAPPPAATY